MAVFDITHEHSGGTGGVCVCVYVCVLCMFVWRCMSLCFCICMSLCLCMCMSLCICVCKCCFQLLLRYIMICLASVRLLKFVVSYERLNEVLS